MSGNVWEWCVDEGFRCPQLGSYEQLKNRYITKMVLYFKHLRTYAKRVFMSSYGSPFMAKGYHW